MTVNISHDNTRTIISLGFASVLALLLVIVLIAINQMENLNKDISRLVEETNAKTAAANAMRDAIRLRAISLKAMRLTRDPFARDEEYLRFLGYAKPYIEAREALVSKSMDPREIELHQKLTELTRSSQPINDRAANLMREDAPGQDIDDAMNLAAIMQNRLLALLDELVEYEERNAATVINTSNERYRETRLKLLTLSGVAFLSALVIALLIIRRITEKNRRISWQACHDELTGLLNRREFEHQLELVIEHALSDEREHALFYMDLDRFKCINDSCGHLAGDEFLRRLAETLKNRLRRTDVLARLGGDEFGMLLIDCPLDKAAEVGEHLREAVENFRFYWEGRTFSAGISIGIVALASSHSSPSSALSAADTACYLAKAAGRNRIHWATTDDQEIIRHRREAELAGDIREALEQDRFRLMYQPAVPSRESSSLHPHAEILLRMTSAGAETIEPSRFVPVAERHDLMPAIDRWVVSHVFDWLEAQDDTRELPVLMINLSGQSLGDDALLELISDRLANGRLTAERICFEITETAAVCHMARAVEFMEAVKRLGCHFALDDFGAGLSSFTYLKGLPVDYVKIDGSFIKEIANDLTCRAMVKSINDIGHVMGKQTIAEFVENGIILEQARKLGIDYVQGYHIARPRPLEGMHADYARTRNRQTENY